MCDIFREFAISMPIAIEDLDIDIAIDRISRSLDLSHMYLYIARDVRNTYTRAYEDQVYV
jgi:hypothetical protein